MDRKEYYEQTGFVEFPNFSEIDEVKDMKYFYAPGIFADLLIQYPNIDIEQLEDILYEKYGPEKTIAIMNSLYGPAYDDGLDYSIEETDNKTR